MLLYERNGVLFKLYKNYLYMKQNHVMNHSYRDICETSNNKKTDVIDPIQVKKKKLHK